MQTSLNSPFAYHRLYQYQRHPPWRAVIHVPSQFWLNQRSLSIAETAHGLLFHLAIWRDNVICFSDLDTTSFQKKKNLLACFLMLLFSAATHVATPHDDLWSLIKWDNWLFFSKYHHSFSKKANLVSAFNHLQLVFCCACYLIQLLQPAVHTVRKVFKLTWSSPFRD